MKKNKKLLIILCAVVLTTLFFILQKSNTTNKKEVSDFAVKDTASISKIFIADRNGNNITLEKKENRKWLVNNKYQPKPDFLKLLLEVIYKINVKHTVAKAAYNNVVKMLASTGIKCEIYLKNNKEPFKIYYVGGHTEDALGTFMIIENSLSPFVMEIPGFNGYLTPRFSTNLDSWRQPILFQKSINEIKSLSVKYTNFPEKSFTIISNNGNYTVLSATTNLTLPAADSVTIDNYLSFYSNVFFEARASDLNSAKKDSLLKYPPSIAISLTDTKDFTTGVDIYPMPITSSSLAQSDNAGNALKYDLDRVYGYIKPEKEFVTIQHLNFDRLLRQITDFKLKKTQSKAIH